MPPATLDALLDHGKIVPDTVESDLDGARRTSCARCKTRRSRSSTSPHDLQIEGVALFSDSFAALLGAIVYKQKLLESGGAERVDARDGPVARRLRRRARQARLGRFSQADLGARCDAVVERPRRRRNHQEIARLARHPAAHARRRARTAQVRRTRRKGQFDSAVVCGMGGSSLAPDILADTFGRTPRLPATLRARLDLLRSRSTNSRNRSPSRERSSSSRARAARRPSPTRSTPTSTIRSPKQLGASIAGRNFVAITDPGTPLDKEAQGGSASAPTSTTIRTSADATRRSPSSASRRRRSPATTSTCCSIGRWARCTPTTAPSIHAARRACASARRSAALAQQRPRQADDRHASRRQGLRRVGRAAHRRIDRQARQGHRADRRRAARRAGRLLRRPALRLRRREPARSRTRRRSEARRRSKRGPSGHSPGDERRLRSRRAVLSVGDRRRGGRRRSWRSTRSINPTCKSPKTTPSRSSSSTRTTASSTSRRPTSKATASTSRTSPAATSISRRSRSDAGAGGLFAQLRPHDYNAITAYIARNPTHERAARASCA